MRHFITTGDLEVDEILSIFSDADKFLDRGESGSELLGKTVMTLFFENSTRTKSSFEVALKRLGARVVHLDIAKSSTSKGETLLDTALNLNAIGADAFIIRHSDAGVPHILSGHLSGKSSVINAGDGAYAHPTQAMLDLFTLYQHFKGELSGKRVAIIGDIKSSRVANSNIALLPRFGVDITLVAPPHFLPKTDLKSTHDLNSVIDEVDAIISLRTQTERHNSQSYGSLKDYGEHFTVTEELIGDRDIAILHPGPVHRNIDLSDAVMADSRSKVLEQVKNGVVVRMAILKHLLTSSE
jgi:aspartate carbamoyltransferase catalytic subunit